MATVYCFNRVVNDWEISPYPQLRFTDRISTGNNKQDSLLTRDLPENLSEFVEPDLIRHDERFARPLVSWKANQAFDKGG